MVLKCGTWNRWSKSWRGGLMGKLVIGYEGIRGILLRRCKKEILGG